MLSPKKNAFSTLLGEKKIDLEKILNLI